MSYFSYRKGLPFTFRSILHPLVGDRIYGPIGHVADIITVAVTAFGIAQTLSLGVIQINSGLQQTFATNLFQEKGVRYVPALFRSATVVSAGTFW